MSGRNTVYGRFGLTLGAVDYVAPVIGLAVTQRIDHLLNRPVMKDIGRYPLGGSAGFDEIFDINLPIEISVNDLAVETIFPLKLYSVFNGKWSWHSDYPYTMQIEMSGTGGWFLDAVYKFRGFYNSRPFYSPDTGGAAHPSEPGYCLYWDGVWYYTYKETALPADLSVNSQNTYLPPFSGWSATTTSGTPTLSSLPLSISSVRVGWDDYGKRWAYLKDISGSTTFGAVYADPSATSYPKPTEFGEEFPLSYETFLNKAKLPNSLDVSDSSEPYINKTYYRYAKEEWISADDKILLIRELMPDESKVWWFMDNRTGPMVSPKRYFYNTGVGIVDEAPPEYGWEPAEEYNVTEPLPTLTLNLIAVADEPDVERDPLI